MPSGKTQVAATVAVLAIGLNSVSAVPVNQDSLLVARNPTINGVIRAGAKAAGDIAHGVATNTVHQKLKNAVNPPKPLDPMAAAAIKKASGPHDPKLVSAVVGPHMKTKKRDLYESLLDEREFDDELFVRNPTVNAAVRAGARFAGDLAHGVATNTLHQKLKDAVNPPKPLDPKAAAAIRMATGPHDHKLVNAVVNNPHLKTKKRDLYDSFLDEREFDDDELFVRNPTINGVVRAGARLAGDLAHGVATNTLHQKAKDAVNPPKPVDPKVAAAIQKASGPHNPKLVNAVIGPHMKTKKRDLHEFWLDERDLYDDDELFVRNPTIVGVIRAGAKAAADLGHSMATNELHKKIKNAVNPPRPVDPRIGEAIKKATGPFHPALVNAVVNNPHLRKSKRDLDDDELFARNPTINGVIRAGAKAAGDVAHGVATNTLHQKLKDAVNPPKHLDPKAAEAIKKASGPFNPKLVNAVIGHKKRDLEDFVEYLVARAMELDELD